jgi:hypothetical protein
MPMVKGTAMRTPKVTVRAQELRHHHRHHRRHRRRHRRKAEEEQQV